MFNRQRKEFVIKRKALLQLDADGAGGVTFSQKWLSLAREQISMRRGTFYRAAEVLTMYCDLDVTAFLHERELDALTILDGLDAVQCFIPAPVAVLEPLSIAKSDMVSILASVLEMASNSLQQQEDLITD